MSAGELVTDAGGLEHASDANLRIEPFCGQVLFDP
jgi:hypothetical protein